MNKTLQSFLKHEETSRRLVLTTLLYLLPAIIALQPVLDMDIWWHLRTGQWIVEHGAVPRVDEFSSYGMGKPWVAYSWFFEILVYSLYRMFGLFGIVLYTVVFSLLIAAALHRLVRRFELNFPAEVALTAAGLIGMTLLYNPRSWLLSILFFIIEIDWLFLARRQGEVRRLFFLPLLFCIWANTHIQFSYGLFVLGLATLEPLVEKFLPHSLNQTAKDWHTSPVTLSRAKGLTYRFFASLRMTFLAGYVVKCTNVMHSGLVGRNSPSVSFSSLALILAASVAATLLTPYHVHLYPALLDIIQQTGPFHYIIEMQALSFRVPQDWFVLALALGAAFSLGWTRKLRPFPLLLLATGIFISFRSRRDVWFIVTVATPIIAAAYSATPATDRFSMSRMQVASCVGMLLVILLAIGWRRDLSQSHIEAVVAEYFPAAAVAAVREHGYTGPLYNDFDWGGFLVWSLRTPPVFMDNRGNVHGDERIEQSLKTWKGEEGWDSDPELTAARLVIANKKRALASLLRLDPRFELVYEDKVAAVFTARAPSQEQGTAPKAPQ